MTTKGPCTHWVVCKWAHELLYCPVDAKPPHQRPCEYDTRTHPDTRQVLTRILADIKEEGYGVDCLDGDVVDMFVVERVVGREIGKLQA